MNGLMWLLAGVGSAVLLAVVALLLVRRAAARRRDTAAEGRLAIKQLASAKDKRDRGTIRGTGSEGDRNMPYQAAYGSDTTMGA
ncbi:hypothetical protein ACIBPB_31435 [Micromonospora sp. NPDC049836]|uniref:hypothetical protein n=1 Tax=Micromonospora sp. NPDC049836 TaxID=3364274 RepID=UPI00379AB0ED